ncbi:hypothetical protein dqs_0599 [Azoarcus olearius]|uniref:Mor transcription activator family protein n=1 Tax=Azoarcus sp. (strain BH72) TaxID=418699 RepID=UPI00080640D8|nr:Mor transcription activator family protein [Azoarcus olearius]ANQ83675.1 hypothetical protein dqs_0599 [Azoarcus olearius]
MKKPAPPILDSDLPATARDLVRLLGWPKAEALIRELGGIPYPVPKGADNNSAGAARYERLVEVVGPRGANALVAEYGGDTLVIPKCKAAIARARMRAMKARCDDGATLEEIALEFDCTTRWVSLVLKRPDNESGVVLEQGGQLGLF